MHYKDPKATISTKYLSTLDRRQLSLLERITQVITTFTCVPMLERLALVQQASSQTKESKRRADDVNDITKGEARLICRCSTSFLSSSIGFFSSCTASSPAPPELPAKMTPPPPVLQGRLARPLDRWLDVRPPMWC